MLIFGVEILSVLKVHHHKYGIVINGDILGPPEGSLSSELNQADLLLVHIISCESSNQICGYHMNEIFEYIV